MVENDPMIHDQNDSLHGANSLCKRVKDKAKGRRGPHWRGPCLKGYLN